MVGHRNITLAGDIQIIPTLTGRNEHGDIQNMKNSSASQPERFLSAWLQLAPLSRLPVGPPSSISLEDPFIFSSHCTPATITPSPTMHRTSGWLWPSAVPSVFSVTSNGLKKKGRRANHTESGAKGLNTS